jgi:hypothetical protein
MEHTDRFEHQEKQKALVPDLRSLERVFVRYVRLCSKCNEVDAANQICNQAWRNIVQSSLYRYLVAPVQSVHIRDPLEQELRVEALKKLQSCINTGKIPLSSDVLYGKRNVCYKCQRY